MRPARVAALAAIAVVAIAAPQGHTGQRAAAESAQVFSEPSAAALRSVRITGRLPRAELRAAARAAATPAAIGDRRIWPALDGVRGAGYLKSYTLRALGTHIEVWVASDQDSISNGLAYPPGDCRNDDRVDLTDAQAQYLAQQFDGNIYPKEATAFSVPRPRDGSRARLPASQGLPADYYVGDGNRIVALVDNIRDENFFDVNIQVGIGGVFVPSFDEQLDRNVITIDGVDWLHRTGAKPPHNPVAGDLCHSRSARPFLIESTFAHEYQHLLESFQDDDEVSWVNEGLSMFAEEVTGYLDSSKPITDVGFSGSTQCFLGHSSLLTDANPNPSPGGPENSLTIWGDKGDREIVCDYGAAETFMEYLSGRFGLPFMSAFHKDPDNGLVSLRKLVAAAGGDASEVLHDWAVMIALDGVLDGGYSLAGASPARYQSTSLHADVNWSSPDAYLTPGAPPNGSDYVQFRNARGGFLKASQITSIAFDGSPAFPPRGVEWSVDANPLDHGGNSALHSGGGGGLDRGIVRQVTVPTGAPRLTFSTRYDLAQGVDFGFVQVSTNAGRTWKSLSSPLSTRSADPSAISIVRRNLPGFTGRSGSGPFPAWVRASFDLSPYRGKKILLAFHYVSDYRVAFPGWWIDDVRVGGTRLTDGGSLAGWKAFSQYSAERVGGFTVQLVGYTREGAKRAFVSRLKLDARLRAQLSGAALRKLLGGGYDVVAAVVTFDDPTEARTAYAPYALRVNGVLQPGGRSPL
jgi:Immune inhibitor A peptidase M6